MLDFIWILFKQHIMQVLIVPSLRGFFCFLSVSKSHNPILDLPFKIKQFFITYIFHTWLIPTLHWSYIMLELSEVFKMPIFYWKYWYINCKILGGSMYTLLLKFNFMFAFFFNQFNQNEKKQHMKWLMKLFGLEHFHKFVNIYPQKDTYKI